MLFLEQAERGGLVACGPAQFEILVRRDRTVPQGDRARFARALDVDRVIGAGNRLCLETGVEIDRDADRVQPASGPRDHFRIGGGGEDVGCAGKQRRPAERSARIGAPRNIAWSHDKRHAKRVIACNLPDGSLELDLDQHRLTGADIGDRVLEHVGTMLFDQPRFLALGLRFFVDLLGFLARFDLAVEDAFSDHHLERIDRTVFGQGIEIGRLHPVIRRVAESLRHGHARGLAVDIGDDIGAQPHRRNSGRDPAIDRTKDKPAFGSDRGRRAFGCCLHRGGGGIGRRAARQSGRGNRAQTHRPKNQHHRHRIAIQ